MRVNNSEDILDSRDVIARRDELQEERDALVPPCLASMKCLCAAHLKGAPIQDDCDTAETYQPPDDLEGYDNIETLSAWDEENAAELATLNAFIEQGSSEWEYGETLVRDSYFQRYAQDLAEDIGALNREYSWPHSCIDWERAARELQMDYTSAEFDGVTYWFRA